METTLNIQELCDYVSKQLNVFFPDNKSNVSKQIETVIDDVLIRVEKCFSKITVRYYKNSKGETFFNHLNGDHYSMFLYLLSNQIYETLEDEDTASKCFLLNKTMFGIDAFYKIKLPEHFLFVHPVGTVLGNADYGDYLVIYQNVTVGSKTDGHYPKFLGKNILYSGSSIIGNSIIGLNAVVAANTTLIDSECDANHTIVGFYPKIRQIKNTNNLISSCFNIEF